MKVNNESKKNTNYAHGDKILFGFPKRTYFELYKGTCSSEKIYSVQNKDFPDGIAAIVYDPNQNVNVDVAKFQEYPAVGRQHVFVSATDDLIAFLKRRGIELESLYYVDARDKGKGVTTIKNAAFVNPTAFDWIPLDDVQVDDEIEEDIDVVNPQPGEPQPDSGEKNGSKTKAILAAIVAVLAALN